MIVSGFLGLAILLPGQVLTPPNPPPSVGERPPEFQVERWFNTDESITLESLRGTYSVVVVWHARDNYSRRLFRTYEKLDRRMRRDGGRLVTLCVEPAATVEKLVLENHLRFPIGAERNTAYDYGKFVPTVMFLDKDGFVSWIRNPIFPSDFPELETTMAAAFGKPPELPAAMRNQELPTLPPVDQRDPRISDAEGLFAEERYGEAFAAYADVAANPLNAASGDYARAMVDYMKRYLKIRRYMDVQLPELKCSMYLRLARIEAAEGNYDVARQHYERILRIFPQGADAVLAKREMESLPAASVTTTRPTTAPAR
ncbi:MAG: redoxin domain-containing protein [Phycisphaerae bacterium]|nr:redoxin domain-containing protein [Phycisphaerae bacterium]